MESWKESRERIIKLFNSAKDEHEFFDIFMEVVIMWLLSIKTEKSIKTK